MFFEQLFGFANLFFHRKYSTTAVGVYVCEMETPPVCESYLSPINGCSGKCIDGVPESGVTRNCLIAKGYAPTIDGLRAAIEEGAAHVHERADGVVVLTNKEKGLKIWSETQTDVPMSFEVNPALPRFFFATQKRKDGKHFLNSR